MVALMKGTFTGLHNVKRTYGPLMGRQATAGPIAPKLDGPKRLLRPLRGRTGHGEAVLLRWMPGRTGYGEVVLLRQVLTRPFASHHPWFIAFATGFGKFGRRASCHPSPSRARVRVELRPRPCKPCGMVCGAPFRPMLLPKPALFLQIKYHYFFRAEVNSIGLSLNGPFTVLLG